MTDIVVSDVLIGSRHLFPFEISCNGNDDIQTIESCLEGYAFDDIQVAAYCVYDYPEEPLLYVFACQCPKSYKAQCVCEGVKKRYCRVGEGH